MRPWNERLLLGAVSLLVFTPLPRVTAQTPATEATTDLRGIVDGILAAWEHADVICLGEGHGDQNDADLRIALVRHPDFARRVAVIVVEFGDVAQQPLLDRLILEGERLSRDQLRQVWSTARGAEVWESPVYEAFLRAVSDVNRQLTRERRVRVLAGDDPARANRGGAIRELIRREILDKQMKGLAIYGARHCERRGFGFPGELADRYPGKIWSAFGFYDVEAGRRILGLGSEPQLVPVTGTDRSRIPVGRMFFTGMANDPATLENIANAIVYYGDRSRRSPDR
ncbi:MAG: ChaN family lipoprotein [Gemmatimonadaceae bacterium]